MIAPDVSFGKFDEWCGKYKWRRNPLFVPAIKADTAVGIHALYAFGQGALGFSPFAIEKAGDQESVALKAAYALIAGLDNFPDVPSVGVLVDKDAPTARIALGGHLLEVNHGFTFPGTAKPGPNDPWPIAGGLILATGPGEFLIIGSGMFVPIQRLNGDETHQGRHARLPDDKFGVQKVALYRY